ncbi:MAG TPA: trypsin-like peptidase domain-containing protein [Telmatospirillum sp.]|nr:trypsin-like peptidase domain-containing protein [Telmatospirillum sp.]
MRVWLRWALPLGLFLLCLGTQRGDSGMRGDLGHYAVRIGHGGPGDSGQSGNAGLYLGRGLVLTAAHVAGSSPLLVVAAGQPLVAKILKAGTFETVDVTLLSIDPAVLSSSMRALPPLALCEQAAVPGQAVVVVDQRGRPASSVIVSQFALPASVPSNFATVVEDGPTIGNSGSGVFDEVSGCLMGIISRKIEWTNHYEQIRRSLKYFIPAADIRSFLGQDLQK